MFFNRWAGGPDGGARYLIHGDDWGQDQRRLGDWMAQRQLPGVFYTLYSGMPEKWGIRYARRPARRAAARSPCTRWRCTARAAPIPVAWTG